MLVAIVSSFYGELKMIKLENVDVYGWEAAIRGMRNPMNSWDKSDSYYGCEKILCYNCEFVTQCGRENSHHYYSIGENDLKLMKSLSKAGNDHSKFLRMINVTVDITAPLYWWKEFDTYKVGTVALCIRFMLKSLLWMILATSIYILIPKKCLKRLLKV